MPTMALESRSRTHQRGRAAYPRLRERGAEGVLRTIRGAGAEDRVLRLDRADDRVARLVLPPMN